jgi:hypothetical protein
MWPPTTDPWVLAAAAVIGTLAVARATRLVTHDTWPPMLRVRAWWGSLVHHGPWVDLVECPFCFAPYAAAVDLLWAVWSGLDWVWWVVNVWAAFSYLAAIVVAYDEPE